MEISDSAGHSLRQCGNNNMLDGSVGALYRAGHVDFVNCGLFGTRGMKRLAKLRLRESHAARWPTRGRCR